MANDTRRIDSHKLGFHPGRVAAWLEAGENLDALMAVAPIYVEVSPIGACNHRCVFCALDYMDYKPRALDTAIMSERLAEMGRLGVKSVMFAGEGEPLLHKGIAALTQAAASARIDTAFTTNGVLLRGAAAEAILPLASWIKVSCNAGTAATYSRIHRTDPSDFDKVQANLRAAVRLRADNHWPVTLGLQILLLPENAHEIETLARLCRDDLGLDYLVVKPYSQHPQSKTRAYADIDYSPFLDLAERLEPLNTERFQVIFRRQTMEKHRRAKPYPICQATPLFWAYVASDGSLCSCSAWLGDPRFTLGNLMEQPFQDLWQGPARRRNLEFVRSELDIALCRSNCRMDAVNIYLWGLKHPPAHVNFI